MLNGIKESKLTKLICGLMLASMALSFSRGIFGSTYNVANSKPNKPANRVLSKASINRKQKVTVASPVIMKQANSKQANSRRNSVKSNIQNNYSVATNTTTWKPTTNNVKPTPTKLSPPQSNPNIDINLLARVIYAESRGEPFKGQVAVGAVLLNRLEDSRFPKDLSQIIFKQGEFCTVRDGQIWNTPNQQAYQAAHLAAAGWDPTGGALYFYNPAKTTSHWIWSRPIVNQIGNHIFAI